jgi:hypothetical protein
MLSIRFMVMVVPLARNDDEEFGEGYTASRRCNASAKPTFHPAMQPSTPHFAQRSPTYSHLIALGKLS